MTGIVILGGTVFLLAATLLLISAREKRHGHRMRSADEIAREIGSAKKAIRESEDRWHQNQSLGRAARSGRPELRRSSDYPWLG